MIYPILIIKCRAADVMNRNSAYTVIAYTDDIAIVASGRKKIEKKISSKAHIRGFKFNPKNTKYMKVSKRERMGDKT